MREKKTPFHYPDFFIQASKNERERGKGGEREETIWMIVKKTKPVILTRMRRCMCFCLLHLNVIAKNKRRTEKKKVKEKDLRNTTHRIELGKKRERRRESEEKSMSFF